MRRDKMKIKEGIKEGEKKGKRKEPIRSFGTQNFVKNVSSVFTTSKLYTLFYNIARKFMLTHAKNLTFHLINNSGLFLWSSVFKNMLNYIISILILHQAQCTSQNFIQNWSLTIKC